MLKHTKSHKTQRGYQYHQLQYMQLCRSRYIGGRRQLYLDLRMERSCPLSLPTMRPLAGQNKECSGKEERKGTRHTTTYLTKYPFGVLKLSTYRYQIGFFLQLRTFHQTGIKHQTKNTNQFSTPEWICDHNFVYQTLQPLNL